MKENLSSLGVIVVVVDTDHIGIFLDLGSLVCIYRKVVGTTRLINGEMAIFSP